MSPRLYFDANVAPDLGAKPFGAKTCNLSAMNNGAELRIQILKIYLQGHIYEKL